MEKSTQNLRQFRERESDIVWVRDYHGKEKWVRGTITAKCGPLTYQVVVAKGLWKRHIDQLSARVNLSNMSLTELPLTATDQDYLMGSMPPLNQTNDEVTYDASHQQTVQDRTQTEVVPPTQVEHETPLRRSSRVRKAPDRLNNRYAELHESQALYAALV